MAGLIDLHIAMLLRDNWEQYSNDLSGFQEMFDKIPLAVSASWHAELAASGLKVRTAFTPEKAGGALAVVQMQDEPIEVQPLGFYAGASGVGDVTPYLSMLVKETVTITMFAGNPEILRAVYVLVRQAVLRASKFLLEAGYESLEYLGGGDIQPERDLLPEDLGVFIRTQRWSVISDSTVKESTVSFKEPHFAVVDAIIDDAGNIGGTTVP